MEASRLSQLLILSFVCITSAQPLAVAQNQAISEVPRPHLPEYTYNALTETFYKLHRDHNVWNTAKVICEEEGATLFYPKTKEEFEFVMNMSKNVHPILLGVHDIYSEGLYTTIDGKQSNQIYLKWHSGEPYDRDGNKDCVATSKGNSMIVVNCAFTKAAFVCQRHRSTNSNNENCLTDDKEYVHLKQFNKCYKMHMKPKTWSQAYRVCILEGSRLTVVDSEEKAKMMADLLYGITKSSARNFTKEYVLAGFHDLFGEGIFRTLDDKILEEAGYVNWANGHPLQASSNCGAVTFYGHLLDVDCYKRALFVCERDSSAVAAAVAAADADAAAAAAENQRKQEEIAHARRNIHDDSLDYTE